MTKIRISDLTSAQDNKSYLVELNIENDAEITSVMGGLACRSACANGCAPK